MKLKLKINYIFFLILNLHVMQWNEMVILKKNLKKGTQIKTNLLWCHIFVDSYGLQL